VSKVKVQTSFLNFVYKIWRL